MPVAVVAAGEEAGLRVQPHLAPAPARVLAVGDSITFGEGVPAGETWSAVLERTLAMRVENAGVPGYSSVQMLGRLHRCLPVFRPSVVLMTLSPRWDRQRCANPFVYKEGFIVGRSYADRLVLIGGNLYLRETRLPVLGTWTALAEGHSNLARLALPPLAEALRGLRRNPEEGPAGPADLEPTARNLLEARQLAGRFGARFLAVMIDDRGGVFHRERRMLQNRLRELGVSFVAADQLIPRGRWKDLRFPLDSHWNAAGHRAMGEALAPWVRRLAAPGPPGGDPE